MAPPDLQANGIVDEPLAGSLDSLLPATQSDRYFDLAFATYRPLRPAEAKFKAENLLWHSLADAGLAELWGPPLRAIQAGVGRSRTIWGVLDRATRRSWELRLANPSGGPGLLDELRQTLAPWLRFAPGLVEPDDYRVLAFEFDAQTLGHGAIESVELHQRGQQPRDMTVTRLPDQVQAHYSVFEAKRDIDEVLPRIKASEFVDFAGDQRLLGRVLIPELFACRRLHIGRNPSADALVFSGVNVEQLLWFVRRFEFPEATAALLTTHREGFEHLLFDVQLGYRFDAKRGALAFPTTGYHGTL